MTREKGSEDPVKITMNTTMKLTLWGIVAVLVALLVGFLWGASGRSAVAARLDESQLGLRLAQSRADLAQARVDVFEVNFGQASRHFETAKERLRDASGLLQKRSADADTLKRANEAIARLTEAQQLAGKLDQSANQRAAEAAKLIDQVAATVPDAAPGAAPK